MGYTIAMIMLLVVGAACALWTGVQRSAMSVVLWLLAFAFTVSGVIVGVQGPGDPYNRVGLAGAAEGWTHYSEELATTPSGVANPSKPTVVVPSGRTVEVPAGMNLRAGTTINYACPPADGKDYEQARTQPLCKEVTLRVLCAQVCPPPPSWQWGAMIAGGVILAVLPFIGWLVGRKFFF